MLNYYVLVFFKTNHLSENFVTLSVERCPFFAWIPTLKKSIFATFPPICPPSTNPHHFSLSGAFYAAGILNQIPCISPIHLLFQGASFAATLPNQ